VSDWYNFGSLDQHETRPSTRAQLRHPRLADVVADRLRSRILSGELPDGSMLPTQNELLEEFRVSSPSVREALRILETEGLVTVQRGKFGGAVVHEPRADKAAYMLAMVLEHKHTALDDVSRAIGRLEPSCAAACAERPDRDEAVLPGLDATIADAEAAVDAPEAFAHAARTFHERLVSSCGNETLILIVGAAETIWSGQVRGQPDTGRRTAVIAERADRVRALDEHRALCEAIRAGDAALAERLDREHLSGRYEHPLLGQGEIVRATRVSGVG
jgi:GntR family transcriptional regulator, transcriptional repressor for pyruvate dehydrogenase complex